MKVFEPISTCCSEFRSQDEPNVATLGHRGAGDHEEEREDSGERKHDRTAPGLLPLCPLALPASPRVDLVVEPAAPARRASCVDPALAQARMGPETKVVLELLGRRLALGPGAQGQGRGPVERGDEDLVPLTGDLRAEVRDELSEGLLKAEPAL